MLNPSIKFSNVDIKTWTIALGIVLMLAPAAPAALVAHWSFEGLNGNDVSGNGHHGVLQGSVGFSGDTPGAFSVVSLDLSSAGDRVATVPFQNFNLGTGDFTVVTFLKRATTSKIDELLGDTGPGTRFQLQLADFAHAPPNVIQHQIGGGLVDSPGPFNVLSDNQWHLAALRRQGGNISVYLDGASVGLGPDASDMNTIVNTFSIGDLIGSANSVMVGRMDDVAIFNTALSDNDLSNIQTGGVEQFSMGLLVPEPASALLSLASIGVLATRRRRSTI